MIYQKVLEVLVYAQMVFIKKELIFIVRFAIILVLHVMMQLNLIVLNVKLTENLKQIKIFKNIVLVNMVIMAL